MFIEIQKNYQKTYSSILLGVFLFLIFGFFASAQAQQLPSSISSENKTDETQMNTIATLNIYEAKIVSQKDNSVTVSFNFNNRVGAQAGVRYYVELGGEEEPVDRYLFPESISIGENETKSMTVSYQAPNYVVGDYVVWLKAENSSGVLLALTPAGVATFKDTGSSRATAKSCQFKVAGDKNYPKELTEMISEFKGLSAGAYPLQFGVDVLPEETLSLECVIVNEGNAPLTINPQITTSRRTAINEPTNTDKYDSFTVASKQQVERSFPINLRSEAQSYEITLRLLDSGTNTLVASPVQGRYVLRGMSGTIQNIVADKDIYAQGDVASVRVTVSGWADSFLGSRHGEGATDTSMNLMTKIISGNGGKCSLMNTHAITDEIIQTLSIPITSDCENPAITVELRDKTGLTLDQVEYAITSTKTERGIVTNETQENDNKEIIFVIIITLVSLVVILFVVIRHRLDKGGNSLGGVGMLLVILGAGYFFMEVPVASADVFSVCSPLGTNCEYFTANLDKSKYLPNERITISGSVAAAGCVNRRITSLLTANYGSGNKTVFSSGTRGYGVTYANAPNAPGSYSVRFDGFLTEYYEVRRMTNCVPYRDEFNLGRDCGSPITACTDCSCQHSSLCYDSYEYEIVTESYTNSGFTYIPYQVVAPNNPPSITLTPSPNNSKKINEPQSFYLVGTDPDGDRIRYEIEWCLSAVCQNEASEFCPPSGEFLSSGAQCIAQHSWDTTGTKRIQARACDEKSACSQWAQRDITLNTTPTQTLTIFEGNVCPGNNSTGVILTPTKTNTDLIACNGNTEVPSNWSKVGENPSGCFSLSPNSGKISTISVPDATTRSTSCTVNVKAVSQSDSSISNEIPVSFTPSPGGENPPPLPRERGNEYWKEVNP